MPNPRSFIKQQHERYQVGLLLQELNHRHRSNYQVVAEPEPPEAIIKSGRTTRWVEVVTVFWNDAYAKDLNTYATPKETHVPIGNKPFTNMDLEFATKFVKAVRSKLEKKGYMQIRGQYGTGYLIVSIQYPFLDASTFQSIQDEWKNCEVTDLGCFRSIYLTFRTLNDYRIIRWKYQNRTKTSDQHPSII